MSKPAYGVFTRERTHDADELKTYSAKVGAARAGHALTPRAFYGRTRVLEGEAIAGAVILEFPTFAEAEAWYDSPLDQEALTHRLKGAEYHVFIVDGVG